MRKATGKVVSLVLALALVITSFSATFASAATKTEAADVVNAFGDTYYLANTNGVDGAKSEQKKIALSEIIGNVTLETDDHMEVSAANVKVTSVSVSGDNILRVTKDSSDAYWLEVRSETGTGTAKVNVLYTGTTDSYRGEDQITVRGSKTFTVVLLDAKTPILGATNKIGTAPDEGEGVSSLNDLQKNPPIGADKKYAKADENGNPYTYAYAALYKVTPASDSAAATYEVIEDVFKSTATAGATASSYIFTVSGTNSGIIDLTSGVLQYGIANPSVGNTVRVSVSNTRESEGSYVANRTIAQDTSKVLNLVKGTFENNKIVAGDGNSHQLGLSKTASTASKSRLFAVISTSLPTGEPDTFENVDVYWDVTGADIASDTALEIPEGRVGDVTATGTLKVTDVTAGDLTGNGVTVNGGNVGAVSGRDSISVNDGAVLASADAITVTVASGRVTGSVTGTNVNVIPNSDEDSASVGAVTATTLKIDSTSGGVAAASAFTAKAAASGDAEGLLLIGSKSSIGSIDADFYQTRIALDGFVGTVPAPKNAEYTGYSETGATLTSDDSDDEDPTKATVDGKLEIYTIELNSGAVTFNSSIEVNHVLGGDADFIVNPNSLYVTDTIGTSNVLKFANAADVKAGSMAFYATSDIADVDSFVRYGYELESKTSSGKDYFVISGVEFAGLTFDAETYEVVKGQSIVLTASVYPNGTQLPEGASIHFYLNGDENYLYGEQINATQVRIDGLDYDADFDVLNTGVVSAVVEDEYEIQLEEYGEATCTVKVVAQKAPTETYKSDTTGDVVVAKGNTYQFKITSLNGQTPSVVLGSDGVFELVGTSQEGSDYFFKFQAVGASGAATGVYVNGDAKVATLYVDGNTGYTCDTTTVNVPAGGTYQVKITAASMPTLLPGNSIYTVAFASQEGNDYFFKITATSAQAGDVVGFYINGGARAFVATTV